MKPEIFAEFVLERRDFPKSALDRAATLLLDTLGVAAAASGMDAGRIAREHALRFMAAGSTGDAAPLLFDGRRASRVGAAYALATQIDNLDAHDGYNPTKGHIGCAVIPAFCAFAEAQPDLDGPSALAALVVGYEVSARAATALHGTVSDYHTSGAWNAIGVAAMGCRMLGLDGNALRQAVGIAEYHGPRSQMMREIANPTMLHDGSGPGAMIGVMAAELASEGFTGAPAITVEAEDASDYWADLGSDWTIERNYIKPYPICRWAHAAIDAMAALVEAQGFEPEDVDNIRIGTFRESARLFPGMPETTSQAQYSLAFAVASRLVHGQVGPDQIQGRALSDPRVASLLARVSVVEEARHTARFPAGRWSDVVVTLKDGRRLASADVNARGGPEAPMPLQEVHEKFLMYTNGLGRERQAAIWAQRDQLQAPSSRIGTLLDLVTAAA